MSGVLNENWDHNFQAAVGFPKLTLSLLVRPKSREISLLMWRSRRPLDWCSSLFSKTRLIWYTSTPKLIHSRFTDISFYLLCKLKNTINDCQNGYCRDWSNNVKRRRLQYFDWPMPRSLWSDVEQDWSHTVFAVVLYLNFIKNTLCWYTLLDAMKELRAGTYSFCWRWYDIQQRSAHVLEFFGHNRERSLVPNWKITIWGAKDSTAGRSSCGRGQRAAALALPPKYSGPT